MMGLLIAAACIVLFCFTRLRFYLYYQPEGLFISFRVAALFFRLYPRKPKKIREGKRITEKRKEKKKVKEKKKDSEKKSGLRELFNFGISDIPWIIEKLRGLPRRLTRLFRFDLVELDFRIGGAEADKTAVRYGKVNRAVWTLYPLVKENFRIRKTNISIRSDYSAEKSLYFGKLKLSMSFGGVILFSLFGLSLILSILKQRSK